MCPPFSSGKADLETDTAPETRFDSTASRNWLALVDADRNGVDRGISTHSSLNLESSTAFLHGGSSQYVLTTCTGRGGAILPVISST